MAGFLRQLRSGRQTEPAASPLQQVNDKEPNMNIVALDPASSGIVQKQPLLSQQSVEYQGHDGYETSAPGKPWKPLMMRRWVLLVLAVIFVLLIVGLEVVLKVSTDRHGFGPTDSNLYYVWTYGPTAVFTIIAAFWTQVDYRTRQMQPWEELAKKPQPVAKSLLLDYISPNPMVSFFRSLKHLHWPVAAVLLGSFVIKVLIVVSTGLFILNPVTLPREVSLHMTERFEFPASFNATNVDDKAGLVYSGVSLGQIEYLPGTDADYATELFNSSKAINEDTYIMNATSKTFTADLSCEPATINPNATVYCPRGSGCTGVYLIMEAYNDNCHMSAFPRNNATFGVTNNGVPYGSWFGGVLPGTCDGKDGDPDLDRLVIFSLYKEQNSSLTNSTAMFCKPSFQLQQSTVTLDQSGSLKSVEPGALLEKPNELTTLALADAVRTSISQSDSILLMDSLADAFQVRRVQYGITNVFLNLILQINKSKTTKDLWDGELMARGARTIFKSVAAQIAKRYFLIPNTSAPAEEVKGTVAYVQQRLFARTPTLRAMEALLCLLIVLCLYLALRPARYTTPQDPASIARLSSMISQSRNFTDTMSHTGFLSLKSLDRLLIGRYSTAFSKDTYANDNSWPVFGIQSHDTNVQQPTSTDGKYWRPLSSTWSARGALLVVPLTVIVVLEITFRESRRQNGLLAVASTKWTEYGSEFVPALVMVLMKLLFSATDFDLRIVDPYVQLKRGYAKATSTVLNKTIYTWKADAVWHAFMNGRIAVGSSTLSVVIASFLTVAASGLFSTAPVSHDRFTNVTRMDSFYDPSTMTAGLNGTFNYTTSLGARLVAYDRMSSPAWTFGPYVIPTLSSDLNISTSLLAAQNSTNTNTTATISVSLPARRGQLTCQLVPSDQIELNYTQWDSRPTSNNGVRINWKPLNEHHCTTSTFNNLTTEQIISVKDGPFGTWVNFDPSFGKWNSPCPSSYGMYGTWRGRRALELNIVLCWSSIQELSATAEFSMPGWKLRSLAADESTARNLSRAWDTQLSLAANVFGGSKGNVSTSMDAVFTALARDAATDAQDLSLVQYANFERLYARIQGIYGRATAQILNSQGRFTNLTTTNTLLAAHTTDFSSSRLQQNVVSTRILQALLIAMLVCGVVSILTLNPKNILPKNPCSIAAQASLVAGSSMVADLPAQAQWMGDEEFDALFMGRRYAMGWSEGVQGQGRFGVDVDLRPKERSQGGWVGWR